ncbi:19715_t:CDS:2, partial [Rhizophagus irregularis]
PISKEKGKNYYDIPRTLHIRKMTWNGYVVLFLLFLIIIPLFIVQYLTYFNFWELLRHLCEEYLSEVAKTMMFKDIETKLINKTIRKFKDQNERFPQTMGDWALREMIRRWVNNY